MQIRAGYQLAYDCPRQTPMLLMLSVHPSRTMDLATPHHLVFDQPVNARDYRDVFGNICTRIVAPTGRTTISTNFVINDPGTSDIVEPGAEQLPIEEPLLKIAIPRARCRMGNHSAITFAAPGQLPASPSPRRKRKQLRLNRPVAKAIASTAGRISLAWGSCSTSC